MKTDIYALHSREDVGAVYASSAVLSSPVAMSVWLNKASLEGRTFKNELLVQKRLIHGHVVVGHMEWIQVWEGADEILSFIRQHHPVPDQLRMQP